MEISQYGIVYHPLSSPTLSNAYTQGIIVERGESGVTVPWDGIERVEITGGNATIVLTDGKKIDGARLRAGTLVGQTASGREMFEELRDLKTIEFKD